MQSGFGLWWHDWGLAVAFFEALALAVILAYAIGKARGARQVLAALVPAIGHAVVTTIAALGADDDDDEDDGGIKWDDLVAPEGAGDGPNR